MKKFTVLLIFLAFYILERLAQFTGDGSYF